MRLLVVLNGQHVRGGCDTECWRAIRKIDYSEGPVDVTHSLVKASDLLICSNDRPTVGWSAKKECDDVSDTTMLRLLVKAFNAHDLDRILGFFSEDCVLETPRGYEPWGTRFTGREAVRKGLAARFEGLPNVHYADDEHWWCGDHVVSKWLLTGTSITGEQTCVRGCDLFDLAPAGSIARKDSYWKIVG